MKILIAATLSLVCHQALAGTVFTLANDNGGNIELTDVAAPSTLQVCKSRLIAKTWGRNTKDMYGCWTLDSSTNSVLIYWVEFDEHRTYRAVDFIRTGYGDSLLNK